MFQCVRVIARLKMAAVHISWSYTPRTLEFTHIHTCVSQAHRPTRNEKRVYPPHSPQARTNRSQLGWITSALASMPVKARYTNITFIVNNCKRERLDMYGFDFRLKRLQYFYSYTKFFLFYFLHSNS